MKLNKLAVKVSAVILTMVFSIALLAGCGSTPKVSKEVNDGCLKFVDIFDAHKKDKYSTATSKELDDYVTFINGHKDKATAEEKEVLDKLGDVMEAYSTDSSEVAKGRKPVLFDQKEKDLKDLLQKYSQNK